MNKPLLQVALDNLSINDALCSLEKVGNEVDIIEIGTILLLSEGKKAISTIKEKYPNKIILADGKIADAGSIVANMLFSEGADITTAICCADIETIQDILNIAKKENKELQIELTGTWSFEQAELWKKIGVQQVVYHRSRDAQAAGKNWTQDDIDKISKLCKMGFKVTITGGIVINDLKLFKNLPIYIIIAGRSIRDANNPKEEARNFQEALKKEWS